jgi:hypothetical protein
MLRVSLGAPLGAFISWGGFLQGLREKLTLASRQMARYTKTSSIAY